MLIVTNSTIHWLVIKEEDRICTSPQIKSTYVMYYSEFDQEMSAFIEVLTLEAVAYENLETKKKTSTLFTKVLYASLDSFYRYVLFIILF